MWLSISRPQTILGYLVVRRHHGKRERGGVGEIKYGKTGEGIRERLGCQFATFDKRLIRRCRRTGNIGTSNTNPHEKASRF
jgi:hypothetical protein